MTKELSDLAPKAQQLWSTWEIRGCVLLSLLLQCFLFLFASERKRTNKSWLGTLISSAYSLADWVVPYTIGLISSRQGGCSGSSDAIFNGVVAAFWASFLLLHLGGLDTTSLSALENDMWLQNFIRLLSQILTTLLIFIRAYAEPGSSVITFVPTYLVFYIGVLKSLSRVRSLYFASSENWKFSTINLFTQQTEPDYGKLFEAQVAMREANLPTQVESVQLPPKKFKPYSDLDFDTANDRLDGKSLLQFAHFFYTHFRGLFAGGVSYGREQRQFTRDFFLKRSSHDAFKLAEIELNFLHEDLHTKGKSIMSVRNAVRRRSLNLFFLILAYIGFYRQDKRLLKNHLQKVLWSKINAGISHALFFWAVVPEIVCILRILLSVQNDIALNCNLVKPIVNFMVNRPKWSQSFSRCNLIDVGLHLTKLPDIYFKIKNINEVIYIQSMIRTRSGYTVTEPLKYTIFTKLCERSKLAHTLESATMICSQRGDWVLMERSIYRKLKWSLGEVEYGHSLLLWHVATDLIFFRKSYICDNAIEQEFCTEISEYLLYLLVKKTNMIAPEAGNWVKFFWDTSQEAKRLIQRSITDNHRKDNHEKARESILSAYGEIRSFIQKEDASTCMLFDACRLADQLLELSCNRTDNMLWSLMSEVWMELLTYAAFHSEASVHIQQPSQGGELLTFVWLLMNHLGLGKQFQEEPTRIGYRVVVNK